MIKKYTCIQGFASVLAFLLFLACSKMSQAQMTFTAAALTQTQNFDATMASTTVPSGWTIDTKTAVDGTVVDFTATSLSGSSSGGAYKFISGTDNSIGFLNSGSFATPNNITLKMLNSTGSTITSLSVTFKYKKYRTGSRQWDWTFFGGATVAGLASIPAGNQTFAADAANTTTYFPPQSTSIATITIPVSIADNGNYYLRWKLTGLGGSSNGQALSVDDVNITAVTSVPCTAPSGLAANNVTSSTADLSWTAVGGASGYEYTVDQTAAAPAVAGTATAGTSYNATLLSPSTTYYLHVRTSCGASFSSWTTISFTTLAVACTAPSGLAANNITTTTADLSWSAVGGATGYQYTVDQTAAAPVVAGTATAATTYNATLLSPSTTYYLHVRTNCGASFSSWTTISFITLTPCPSPSGLAANGITTTSANLSWNTVGTALNYEYIVDQNAATPAGAGTVTAGTTYNATLLTPSTVYYLHVRANCGTPNYSAWTTVSFTTLTPCPDPTGLAANNITTTSADLSWNTVGTALNYEYTIDQNAATPAVAGTVIAGTTYNATLLTPSTVYYLHVRANCGTPNYSAWTTVSFTTLTPCPDPTGLAANNVTTTSADLSWNTVGTALNYEYIIDQNAATPAVAGTITTGTIYNATLLTPSTVYYLHVRANCGTPNYSAWVTVSFTTLTPCPDPTGLAANNVTTTSADLSWNTVGTALNYEYIIDQNAATPAVAGTVIAGTAYNAALLTPSTVYYLHVRANCGTPNYSAWTTVSFTTLTPCPDPTGLAANNISTTSADLSWNTVGTALNYEYIVDQNAATPAVAGTVIAGTTYNATLLTPSTTYYLHVRANCGTPNYSAWVTVSFTTLTPCPAPAGLTASLVTNVSAHLSWDSLSGPGYEYVLDQTIADPSGAGISLNYTFADVAGLSAATTYYLHVRSDCGANNFSPWITDSFKTMSIAENVLMGWDVNGQSGYGASALAATTIPPAQVLAGDLTRGSGLSVPADPAKAMGNAWGATGLYGSGGPYVNNEKQDLIDNNAFIYFKAKSTMGYTVSLSSFDMYFGRYGISSPENAIIQYGIDSTNFTDLDTNYHTGTPNDTFYCYQTIDLRNIPELQNVNSQHSIYFRILPVYAANDTETAAWYIYNGNNDPALYDGADIFLRGHWDISLPLTMLSFTGTALNTGNVLNWVTDNEKNIKGFELQRSFDAKSFEQIGNIAAKGVRTATNYEYTDNNKIQAKTYYRLKVQEMNGSYSYSKIVAIERQEQSSAPSVYPNPVNDVLHINTNGVDIADVKISDMLGRTWDVQLSAATGGSGVIDADVRTLPHGMYTVSVINKSDNSKTTIVFMKN